MAKEDDKQLANIFKESLVSIEGEVEHAANLEHSKLGSGVSARFCRNCGELGPPFFSGTSFR